MRASAYHVALLLLCLQPALSVVTSVGTLLELQNALSGTGPIVLTQPVAIVEDLELQAENPIELQCSAGLGDAAGAAMTISGKGTKVSLANLRFTQCKNTVINVTAGALVSMKNVRIYKNSAPGNGAVLQVVDSTVAMSACTLDENVCTNCSLVLMQATSGPAQLSIADGSKLMQNSVRHLVWTTDARTMRVALNSSDLWNDMEMRTAFTHNNFSRHYSMEPVVSAALNTFVMKNKVQVSDNVVSSTAFKLTRSTLQISGSTWAANKGAGHMLVLTESRLWLVNSSLKGNLFRNGTFFNISQHFGINALEGVVFEDNEGDMLIDVMGSTLFKDLAAYQDARYQEEQARQNRDSSPTEEFYNRQTILMWESVKEKDRNKQTTPLYLGQVKFINCSVNSSLIHINGSDPQNIRRVADAWRENSTLLHMVDVTIKGCSVAATALLHMQHFNSTITRLTVQDNRAPDLINVNSNTLMLFDSNFSGNQPVAPDAGALLKQKWSWNRWEEVVFEDNKNFEKIVEVIDSTAFVDGCSFINNTLNATKDSSGIFDVRNGDSRVRKSRFEKNTATITASAASTAVTVESCSFLNNTGTSLKLDRGGSLHQQFISSVKECQFMSNKGGDGTLSLSTGRFVIANSNFSDNKAVRGGAIFSTTTETNVPEQPKIHVTGCLIEDNEAERHGGGLWVGEATAVNTTKIVHNTAFGTGGGVYVYNTLLFMGNDTEVSINTAASGGAITALEAKELRLSHMVISDNLAKESVAGAESICEGLGPEDFCEEHNGVPCRLGGGGALCSMKGRATLEHVAIQGNTASYGGGLYVDCAPKEPCLVEVRTNTTLEPNALHTASGGTGEILVASSAEAVCCGNDEACVPFTNATAADLCPQLSEGAANMIGLSPSQRKVASLPSSLRGEIIQPEPVYPVRPGSQVSMNVTMVGAFGEDIQSMPVPINVTVHIEPRDVDMLLVGNTTMNFTFPYTVFRNLTINRAVTSQHPGSYSLVFSASSSQLQDYIAPLIWKFTVRACTLGEYANQYRCDSCSELNRKQFSLNTAIRCEPCPEYGLCEENGTGLLIPRPGVFQTSALMPQLTRCPMEEACGKGRPFYENERQWALEATLRELSHSYSSGGLTWEKAMELDKKFKAQQCAQGYTGTLCGTCEEGYGRFFSRCNKCLGPGFNAVILLLFIALLFAIISVTAIGHMRTVSKVLTKAQTNMAHPQRESAGGNEEASKASASVRQELHELTAFTAVFKVFVTYAQSLSMIRGMALRLPRGLRNMFAGMDFGSAAISWVSLDCSTKTRGWTSAALRVSAPLLVPIICTLGATIFWTIVFLFKHKAGHKDNFKFVRDRLVMTTVQIAYFLYPAITTAVFAMFNCYKIDGPSPGIELEYFKQPVLGHSAQDLWIKEVRWMQDFDTRCWVGRHFHLALAVGMPALLVYVLGVPFGFALLLWRKRNLIEEPRTILTMGFLYDGYKNKFFWWELVIMGRKLLLLICSLLINSSDSSSSYLQLCLCTLVVVCSLLLQQWCLPFSNPFINGLETIALFAVNVTYILIGIFVIPENISSTAYIFALTTTICINIFVILLFFWYLAQLGLQWLRRQLEDNPDSCLKMLAPNMKARHTRGPDSAGPQGDGWSSDHLLDRQLARLGQSSGGIDDVTTGVTLTPTSSAEPTATNHNIHDVIAVVPAPAARFKSEGNAAVAVVTGGIPGQTMPADVRRGDQGSYGQHTGAGYAGSNLQMGYMPQSMGVPDARSHGNGLQPGYQAQGRVVPDSGLPHNNTNSNYFSLTEAMLPHQNGMYTRRSGEQLYSHQPTARSSDDLPRCLQDL